MIRLLLIAVALIATPTLAHAQVSYPPTPGTSVDLAPLQARIDAAQAKADAATLAAQNAAAAVPPVCSTAPMPDTLNGSAGTGIACSPRDDATRPTIIQAKTTTTLSDATYSVTFDKAFATVPIYADARVYGSQSPYLCTVTTLTTSTASGKCYQLVATTLPTVTTSLLGLVVSPIASAASGLSVRVVARQ